jgi:hypothetical protein
MPQAVSRLAPRRILLYSRTVHAGFGVENAAQEKAFLQQYLTFLSQCHSSSAPDIYSSVTDTTKT